jgi:hypothetical protein
MTTILKRAAVLASSCLAGLAVPLTAALPAEGAVTTTVNITTTKAKLESDAAYRIDEKGGKKLLAGPHFDVSVYVTCPTDALSQLASVQVYVGDDVTNSYYAWVPCGSSMVATLPGVKGRNTVTAVATSRYGFATDTETVKVIAPAQGPAS